MKLSELASKPKLTEIIIDDEAIVEKYGEELQFYILDRLPLETYTNIASIKQEDAAEMYAVVKDLILDQDGQPVIQGENVLPIDVMNAAMVKVTESLGK